MTNQLPQATGIPKSDMPLSVVVAGGGTAGHIEPALAVAEAVQLAYPHARVTALGTAKGLESQIVPARGVDLQLIPPVPVPRKLSKDLFTLPFRLLNALKETKRVLRDVEAQVVIGFGGYVSAPAYIAARSLNLPFFVHEANARAGMANKLGVKLGGIGLAAVPNSGLQAEVVGIPVKQAILQVDRDSARAEGRAMFGLDHDKPVLLVTGGSQGAASINAAMEQAAEALHNAGVQVLHSYGKRQSFDAPDYADYHAHPYIDRMDLAYCAADMIVCRSGAMTVAEISSVGLPAIYVPLPHGNGEQELNALPVVEAGGGSIIHDADLSGAAIAQAVIPLIRDPKRLAQASEAARLAGHRDAATRIVERLVAAVSRQH